MKILLDTSIIIDYLRAKNKTATPLYQLVQNNDFFAVSILTHTELWAGQSVWESKKKQLALKELFKNLKVIEVDKKHQFMLVKFVLNKNSIY